MTDHSFNAGRLRSRAEAAHYLGISIKTLMREVTAGRLSCIRIGRRVMFADDQLVAYTDAHTHAASAAL